MQPVSFLCFFISRAYFLAEVFHSADVFTKLATLTNSFVRIHLSGVQQRLRGVQNVSFAHILILQDIITQMLTTGLDYFLQICIETSTKNPHFWIVTSGYSEELCCCMSAKGNMRISFKDNGALYIDFNSLQIISQAINSCKV